MSLSKKAKNIIIVISVLGTILLGLLTWLIVELVPFKGSPNDQYWVQSQTLKLEDTVVIEKEKDKDFVILNLTDVQFNDAIDMFGGRKLTEQTVKELIEKVQPDLITITGDIVWAQPFTRHSIRYVIDLMDSFKIKWAPVFGNHDEDGNADLAWFADRLLESEYCVFQKGPNNVGGLGNYIINITEEGRIVQSLFMLDSGRDRAYPDLENPFSTYDFIGADKQAWYMWAVKELTRLNNGVTPMSSIFLHIALPEYQEAYNLYYDKETDTYDETIGFGKNYEDVFSPPVNSGFFDVILAAGSTKNIVAGHDHVNYASVLFEGVRLTYGLKTGDRCYWVEDGSANGGTTLTVNSAGEVQTQHVYVTVSKK